MSVVLVATLAGLALLDSTSIGTLGVPVWMLLRPALHTRRLLLYLGTIALFYWAVGVAMALGIDRAAPLLAQYREVTAVLVVQLVLGAGMLTASVVLDN